MIYNSLVSGNVFHRWVVDGMNTFAYSLVL